MAEETDGEVLLVEDTPSLLMVYRTVLENAGLRVRTAQTLAEARAAWVESRPALVLLDLMLPDGNGLDLLDETQAEAPDTRVIVITANGSINRAVEAMRAGAFDFLVKPFDDRKLLAAVRNARDAETVAAGPLQTSCATGTESQGFQGFVGTSASMQAIYDMVRNIGRSTATVFITGESGTGKEVTAQAIHDVSNRGKGPFVPINCGAIPRDLLESEVFGHLKGSFTGAIADKKGAAAMADGGTLFLDEICEMDFALQTKLLRFLQTSMIQPVGASQPRKVDVRIICATNRDPKAEVAAGRFRADLFYRLHVVPIALPPLRDRGRDVIEIARAFLRRFSTEEGKDFARLSPATEELFLNYAWPGNVRQLQNVLRNVAVMHDGAEVTPEMVSLDSVEAAPEPPRRTPLNRSAVPSWYRSATNGSGADGDMMNGGEEAPGLAAYVGMRLADLEREFIEATITTCDGSIPRAARVLDVSPSTLYRKRETWLKS